MLPRGSAAAHSAIRFRQGCGGHGADAVLITAETASSEPVDLAGEVARDRGVVVAVGTVGMDIQRKLYFEKELDFRISRSYGPGRYDSAYEQKGRDYPIGYVRWTETRNMEAFLQLLSEGKLDVKSLITHRFPIERALGAYDLITGKVGHSFLGVLIAYPEQAEETHEIQLVGKGTAPSLASGKPMAIGVLGAGSFAMSTLLPAIKQLREAELIGVCAANGPSCRGEVRLPLLRNRGAENPRRSRHQHRRDCHASSSARGSGAGRDCSRQERLLREATLLA